MKRTFIYRVENARCEGPYSAEKSLGCGGFISVSNEFHPPLYAFESLRRIDGRSQWAFGFPSMEAAARWLVNIKSSLFGKSLWKHEGVPEYIDNAIQWLHDHGFMIAVYSVTRQADYIECPQGTQCAFHTGNTTRFHELRSLLELTS